MTETKDRAEAARIQMERIAAGEPFEQVFRPKERLTRAPGITYYALYSADDVPSPHGGSTMRAYLLDCRHATSQKELMDMDATRDLEVLVDMVRKHRAKVYISTGQVCDCEPVSS